MQILSIVISVVALCISILTAIQGYISNRRSQKIDQAKRVGEALVGAQLLKNRLSEFMLELDRRRQIADISGQGQDSLIVKLVEETTTQIQAEFKEVSDSMVKFEFFTAAYEKRNGKFVSIDPASVEASIALFNRNRVMAEHDIRVVSQRIENRLKSLHD